MEVVTMKWNQLATICGIAAALCAGAGTLMAQDSGTNSSSSGQERRGRGNFDPAQFEQRMMDNTRERLGFTNDTDWAAVQPLVQKVFDARRAVGFSGMGFGRGGRGGGGNASQNSDSGRRGGFNQPSPEAEALQSAIDAKAPVAQVKAALEKYRALHKDKEAQLQLAQENLRKVLTVHQEAQAVLLGLVN
jgi:hypothetical protein